MNGFNQELNRYARMLGKDRPDVKTVLRAASRSKEAAQIATNVLRGQLIREGIDPDDDSPFLVAPAAYDLGGNGVRLGSVVENGSDLIWRFDEVPYSGLFIGAPGFGKTSAIIHLLLQLTQFFTVIVTCLRGDYECLCRVVKGARLFSFGHFPINLLRGPSRVPPTVFNQRFAHTFTDQFGLFQSSRRYLSLILDKLETRRRATGHWPCLLDLRDALERKKEQRGSDELRFRNRCLARVDALCRSLGDGSVGVEQGIDLEELIESGSLLIFRMELEQSIQDFLTNWLLMFAFEHRTWNENKFARKPIVFVLDEQRSILRIRR